MILVNFLNQSQSSSSTSKLFTKIPATYKTILQIVNGVDEAVSENLNDAAMKFFALSSAKLAHIHLNSLLETENIRVSISPAFANHLRSGSFF